MAPNLHRLLSIVERELGVDPSTLKPDSLLAELADSLDWVNLLGALEEGFGLKIDSDEGLRLRTLQDLVNLVNLENLENLEKEPRLAAA
jgi:acyl carrier protein